MKKILAFVLSILLLMTTISVNAAQIYYDDEWHTYNGNFFSLMIDGKEINCEVPPIVFNDYSVVPAREVFESMGATVEWTAKTQTVSVISDDVKIELKINSKVARKNGVQSVMPIAAKLINGKTMIPVRYVAEALGHDVNFDSKTDTISIKTNKKEEQKPEISNPAANEKPVYSISMTSYSYSRDKDCVNVVFTFTQGVEVKHFMLKEPQRLVVDTKNTQFPTSLKSATTGYDDVTGIRIGQQTEGVRIVFDLAEELDYKVSVSGKKMTVKIGKNIQNEETVENETVEETPEVIAPVIPDPPTYKATRTVYLDPGHGGSDPGATYTDEDGKIWKESDINLGVALKVRDILAKNDVKVLMSRDKDVTVELGKRPLDANEKEATLFVSIHTNSFFTDVPIGIETIGTLEYSAAYQGITDKELAENIHKCVIKKTGGTDRGVKDSTTLAVLRHSIMPSVLIEVGFISNKEEREKLFDDNYRQKIADGIAEGILKTLEEMGV